MKTLTNVPDVREALQVTTTDWGEVWRVDAAQLGAAIPSHLGEQALQSAKNEEARRVLEEQRLAWRKAQNDALLDAMAEVVRPLGGDLRSYAEWTVAHGPFYDVGDIREKRRVRFGASFRSAITTMSWLDPHGGLAARVQATAFIPKSSSANFRQEVWRPKSLYDTEFMALAPAVVSRFGGVRFLFLSGVTAWDKNIQPLFKDEPRRQIRRALEMIIEVFEEAGGSKGDVVRLRPFAHNVEIAQMIREEAAQLWAGDRTPTILMADNMSFGHAPEIFTEIQAMGILADEKGRAVHDSMRLEAAADPAALIHRVRTRDWELIQAAEIRASQDARPEEESGSVLEQIRAFLKQTALVPGDICGVFAYAGTAQAAHQFGAAAHDLFPRKALHLVPCCPMAEMGRRQLKVEITARRAAH